MSEDRRGGKQRGRDGVRDGGRKRKTEGGTDRRYEQIARVT